MNNTTNSGLEKREYSFNAVRATNWCSKFLPRLKGKRNLVIARLYQDGYRIQFSMIF